MNYELSNGAVINDEVQSAIMERLVALDVYRNPDYTWDDIGMATLMGDVYRDTLRYCPQNGKWYVWEDRWCKQGDAGAIMDILQTLLNILRVYCAEMMRNTKEDEEILKNYDKFLRSLRKFNPMRNIIETLKTVLNLRMSLGSMDANPYLLNTTRGAYDLRTAERIPDIREFNVTKKTSCGLPDFTTVECTRWYQFINEIMSGDNEKIAFLQRALGYSILGINREECMFVAYGSKTRNGKGTLFSTISTVLGSDYVGAVSPDLICEGKNGKSTDFNAPQPALTKLVGTRLVTMSESSKDVRLDAASMKTITGRDTLTTRDLYESSFDFVPQFTLWLNTNHLPAVTDDTVFSSNRIWVIEFNEHFDEQSQDKDLKELFARPENRPTILKWLFDGCSAYLKDGLRVPKSVREATENYRKIHDRVGCFLEEMCDRSDDKSRVLRGKLYSAYRQWCFKPENKYNPLSSTNFYNELMVRGCSLTRHADGWYIVGVKISENKEGGIQLL